MKVNYEIILSETLTGKKYNELIIQLKEHFNVLMRNGKPVRSLRALIMRMQTERKNFVPITNGKFEAEIEGKMGKLVKEAAKILGVDLILAAKSGVLTERGVEDRIIYKKYHELMKEKPIEKKEILAKQYEKSVSKIENIVYRRKDANKPE